MSQELLIWPTVVVIEDCFIPELSELVLEVAGERDEQTCGLVWQFHAEAAREAINVN